VERPQESVIQARHCEARRRLNVVGHVFILVMLGGFLLIVVPLAAAWCWAAWSLLGGPSQDTAGIGDSGRLVVFFSLPAFAGFAGLIIWFNRRTQRKEQRRQRRSFRQWLHSPLSMYVRSAKVVLLIGLAFASAGIWMFRGAATALADSAKSRAISLCSFWAGAIFFLIGAGLTGLMVVRMIQEKRGWEADLGDDRY